MEDAVWRDGNGTGLSQAQALGKEAWGVFLELHGLYCLLSALLQRLEICSAAVQDYASFICFLPVHEATLLDLEQLFPQLQSRIQQKTKSLMTAYEGLPRQSVPGRALLLERCRSLLHQLQHTDVPCRMAKDALRTMTPQATLQDFSGWRDERWKQFARLQLAARVLLKPEELEALGVWKLSTSLSNGERLAISDVSRPRSEAKAVPVPDLTMLSLRHFVDEDTRLHQAACKLAVAGQSLGQHALHGAWWTAALLNAKAKQLLPEAQELAPSLAKVTEILETLCKGDQSHVDIESMEWVVLDGVEEAEGDGFASPTDTELGPREDHGFA